MTIRTALAVATLVALALSIHAQNPGPPSGAGQTAGTAIVTGRVVDAQGGAPIPAATVTLKAARVLTDAEGRFFFTDVVPGRATIGATKPGWIAGSYGRRAPGATPAALELKEGDRRADLTIAMWRGATISGRVLDDTGEPMVNVDIRVVQQPFVAGHRLPAFAGRTHTDDRGMYRFPGLVPGDYLVVVPATITTEPPSLAGTIRAEGDIKGWMQTMTALGTAPMVFDHAEIPAGGGRSLVASILALPGSPAGDDAWQTYPTTYFPSATSIGAASPVRAESGRDRAGVDLTVRLVKTYPVSGVLTGPDGPAASHSVHLIPAESADAPLIDAATAVTDAAGAFTFYGVAPGQYVARVVRTPYPTGGSRLGMLGGTGAVPHVDAYGGGPSSPIPTEPLLSVDQPVSVSDHAVTGLALAMKPGPRVSGHAEFDGSASVPTATQWSTVPVVLERANGLTANALGTGQFNSDGQFATPSLWPGRYLIRVTNAPPGWTFKSATYEGRDVSETPIDLRSDIDNVVITFTDHPAKVTGTVQDADDKNGVALVILFPIDRDGWADYGRGSRRFFSVPVAVNGTFTLPAPPAGDYALIAIPDAAVDWKDPAMLTKLAAVADRIQVRDGQPVTHTLQVRRIQ